MEPGMKNLNITLIVLEIGRPNTTKEGHEVQTRKVDGRSGPGTFIQQGDICKLTKAYTSLDPLHGEGGDINKTGGICIPFSETPFMSEPNPEFHLQLQAKLSANMDQRRSPTSQLVGGAVPMGISAPLLPLPGNGNSGGIGFGPEFGRR
ncbi:unnamed protein product, partial [Ixodes hexagonus]